MRDFADLLLDLYRAARERDEAQFQQFVFEQIGACFNSDAGLWGVGGYQSDADNNFVPTRLATSRLDPDFLIEWATAVKTDPVAAVIRPRRLQALRVHVPSFYADTPDLAEIGKVYGISAMTCVSMPSYGPRSFEFLSLYRKQADDACTDMEKRWLECFAPHLSEAGRIQRTIHSNSQADLDIGEGSIAVAEVSRGHLLSAQPRFLALMAREWKGFDGSRLPTPLRSNWHISASAEMPGIFTVLLRHGRIQGRRIGDLVYLTAFEAPAENSALTARQLQVAILYAEGLAGKQIARQLGISSATVRTHLATAYDILGVSNKVGLARRLNDLRATGQRNGE